MFGAYVEQEPYVRELIEAYMASKFKVVLEVLGRYSVSVGLGSLWVERCAETHAVPPSPELASADHLLIEPSRPRHPPRPARLRAHDVDPQLGRQALLPAFPGELP